MKFISATEWLFYNLWTHNPSSNFNNSYVKIAGTLIFRWGKPYVYYTTNEKGKIIRISKSKLEKDAIQQLFDDSSNDIPIKMMRLLPIDDNKSLKYRIEIDHMEMNSLNSEMNSFNDKKILQKFILPKNNKNRMY